MSTFRNSLVVLAALTLLCLLLPSCPRSTLSLQLDSPEDGAEFSVNVQKVSGIVSDPEATVQVNGIEAKVDRDGAFYAYIDLTKGENTIEAGATRGNDTHSETITVSFSPELAVYLNLDTESGINYNITPLAVSGWVTDAKATVTVNDNQVQVTEDGSFSVQVKLEEGNNGFEAVATLNGKEDSWIRSIILTPEGQLMYIPGQGFQYLSKVLYDNDVQLKAGETKLVNVVLDVRKDISNPEAFSCNIYRVAEEYAEDELPMPDGLIVMAEPSNFTAYPNTVYQLTIIIETAPELAPGMYFLRLEHHLEEGFRSGGWITITVEG